MYKTGRAVETNVDNKFLSLSRKYGTIIIPPAGSPPYQDAPLFSYSVGIFQLRNISYIIERGCTNSADKEAYPE